MKKDGKITFGGIILMLISLMQSQIENEVTDSLGLVRGVDLTSDMACETIREVLKKNDVIFDEKNKGIVEVTIDRKAGKMFYYFRYEVETNFIFFKNKKTVEVKDEMRSYG